MLKRVLITGCSTGLGKALCELFHQRGYYVIATARNLASLENVEADRKLELDVTNDEQIHKVIEEVGQVDILINNAGFSVRAAMEELDIQKYRKMYEVNVVGIIKMIQATAPILRKQGGGRIINIGSISGRMTGIVNGGYCSTKRAVEAITEAARYELRDSNIEVSVIEPGAMETEFFKTLSANSDGTMHNPDSPYFKLYERDLAFRSKQNRTPVEESAKIIADIVEKKKLKVRYTVSVSWIYKLLCHLPDGIKEKLILRFN